MKKLISVILTCVLLISICSFNATAITQEDALSWAVSKIGSYYDQDGVYGSQCVDMVRGYYNYFGYSAVQGNAKDYVWNNVPSGFTRYALADVPGGIQPGDVFVYTGGTYGHVGIIYSVNSASSFVSVDANWPAYNSGQPANDTGLNSRTVKFVTHNNYNIWGVIRPMYSSSSATTENWLTTAGVNMRAGAGTDYDVLLTVPTGTNVTVNDKVSAGDHIWGRVTYSGKIGYIALTYATKQSGTFSQTWRTTAGVNMRSGAGTTHDILLTVPTGTTLTVTLKAYADSYTWGNVTYGGKSGWIALNYATEVDGPPPEVEEPTTVPEEPTTVPAVPTTAPVVPTTVPVVTTTVPVVTTTTPVITTTAPPALTTAVQTPTTIAEVPTIVPIVPTTVTEPPTTTVEAPPIIFGDANDDGYVSIVDVTMLQRHLAKIDELSQRGMIAANIDGNPGLSIADGTQLQKYLAYLIADERIGKPVE
jgi:uncharacterized protein YgiM (DUF1202 family)